MHGAGGPQPSKREKNQCLLHISYVASTALSTPSPESLLSGNGPSSHPDTLVNHFGVISDYILSLPPYCTNHQQILSTLLSKYVLTRTNSSHLLHYHSSPSSHLANMMVSLLPLLSPYNCSLWNGWNRNNAIPLFKYFNGVLLDLELKFTFMSWSVKSKVIWLPVTMPISLSISAVLTLFKHSGFHVLPEHSSTFPPHTCCMCNTAFYLRTACFFLVFTWVSLSQRV